MFLDDLLFSGTLLRNRLLDCDRELQRRKTHSRVERGYRCWQDARHGFIVLDLLLPLCDLIFVNLSSHLNLCSLVDGVSVFVKIREVVLLI